MKKRYHSIFYLLVAALIIYIFKDVDFLEVYDLLLEANFSFFLTVFLLIGAMFIFWSVRFSYSLRNLTGARNYFFSFCVLMAGVFVNTITPGSNVGGEPVRAYYLNQKYNKPKTKFLGAIFGDKVFHMFVFGLFLVFSLLFFSIFIKGNLIFDIFIYVFLFLVILFLVLLFRKKIRGFSKLLYRLKFIRNKFEKQKDFETYLDKRISNFNKSLKETVFNKKFFIFGVTFSFFIWILNYLATYFVFLSLGVNVNFLIVIVVVSLGYLIGDVSPIPGGVGIVESAMYLLYSSMNIESSVAITVALLSRLIYYFYAIIIGGLCLFYLKNKNFKNE